MRLKEESTLSESQIDEEELGKLRELVTPGDCGKWPRRGSPLGFVMLLTADLSRLLTLSQHISL